jgi:hypothetical protein
VSLVVGVVWLLATLQPCSPMPLMVWTVFSGVARMLMILLPARPSRLKVGVEGSTPLNSRVNLASFCQFATLDSNSNYYNLDSYRAKK